MARKKPKGTTSSVLFDVFYEDGSRNSNSKVPAELLGGLDGDGQPSPNAPERPPTISE